MSRDFARHLRKTMTDAEQRLWHRLRQRQPSPTRGEGGGNPPPQPSPTSGEGARHKGGEKLDGSRFVELGLIGIDLMRQRHPLRVVTPSPVGREGPLGQSRAGRKACLAPSPTRGEGAGSASWQASFTRGQGTGIASSIIYPTRAECRLTPSPLVGEGWGGGFFA